MKSPFSRREWLRSGALLAAGFSGLSRWNPAQSYAARREQAFFKEFAALADDQPRIRARIAFNENPHGISPKAKEALIKAVETGHRYSWMESAQLKQLIATKEGVKPEQVMLCAGSSEILMGAALYFTGEGGKIATCRPTYDDLLELAQAFKAEIVSAPLTKEYSYDLNALKAKVTPDVKLVYICNPNNPTGTIIPPNELTAFCKEVSQKVPVFVDEAYIDFMKPEDRPVLPKLIAEGYNVLITRTFSKIHGFAGLRLGYAIGPEKMLKGLRDFTRGEFNLSVTTVMAGIASYQDTEWQSFVRAENTKGLDLLYKGLKEHGYEYTPTHANFVLFPIRMKGKKFEQEMFKNGIFTSTREFDAQPYCRVSIGTLDEMGMFMDVFKKIAG
ncbi:pyridoxal phosphate-dependent aminotransferase [Tellurirhabdus bombi]|uniref:pyridoxal phosphate-dependent aminotransferase n=1 Tax=Tellurirhabdus bombi TaxID=2907205 RepID=UPI001F491B36|nr:histidinol-phosphate transaminase [Tellurirhabdus bombi]